MPSRDQANPWRRVVEALPHVVWTLTANGLADYFSPRFSTLTGLPADTLLGRGWLEAIHPDERWAFEARWMEFIEDGREFRAEACVRAPGEHRWFVFDGAPVRDDAGAIVRWVGSAVDITDRKVVEAERDTATRHLDVMLRLSGSSLWEFAMANGAVAQARLVTRLAVTPAGFPIPLAALTWIETFTRARMLPEDIVRATSCAQAAVDTGTRDFQLEFRIFTDDGVLHWRVMRGTIMRDASGKVTSIVGTGIDITDLKQATEATRLMKERLQRSVLGSRACTWDCEISDGAVATSRATFMNVLELVGYGLDDMGTVAEAASRLFHPEDAVQVLASVQSALAGSACEWDRELRVRHKDGSDRWHLAHGMIERDPVTGHARRLTGSSVDITDLKRIEAQLRESERRWRSLAETLPQLIWTSAADGRTEYVSSQFREYTGLTDVELLAEDWAKIIHPDERTATMESWLTAFKTKKAHEMQHRIRGADGEYRWFTTRAVPARGADGEVISWVGSSTEITALKQLESDARNAKDLLELGIRGSRVGIFDFDFPDGDIESGKQTMINVWETRGFEAAYPNVVPQGTGFAVHPDDLQGLRDAIQTYFKRGNGDFEFEYRVHHKDGSILWRLARGIAFWKSDGTPVRLIGSLVDVTDRKRIEAQLRASEQRWRGLAETLQQFVFTTGPDGAVDYFNSPAMAYTGKPVEALLGFAWAEVIHAEDREYTVKGWLEALERKSPHVVTHRIRSADHEYRWFRTQTHPVRHADGRIDQWVGTCTDINTFKELEAELRHAKELNGPTFAHAIVTTKELLGAFPASV